MKQCLDGRVTQLEHESGRTSHPRPRITSAVWKTMLACQVNLSEDVHMRMPQQTDRHSSVEVLNLLVGSHFIWARGNGSTSGWADGGKWQLAKKQQRVVFQQASLQCCRELQAAAAKDLTRGKINMCCSWQMATFCQWKLWGLCTVLQRVVRLMSSSLPFFLCPALHPCLNFDVFVLVFFHSYSYKEMCCITGTRLFSPVLPLWKNENLNVIDLQRSSHPVFFKSNC